MQRLDSWPEKLHRYLDGIKDKPFLWGWNDCGMFSANGILEMTGEDPAFELRGSYDDEIGALRALRSAGCINLMDYARMKAQLYGWESIDPAYLQRGDLVAFNPADWNANERFGAILGLCYGPVVGMVTAQLGVRLAPKRAVVAAWRV